MDTETTRHYILKCICYINLRRDLLRMVDDILEVNNIYPLNEDKLVELLLYGHKDLHPRVNQTLLKATINFISKTGRFSQLP